MDVGTLDAISRLSSAGLLAGALAALVLRYVYTRGEVRDRDAVWKERFDELRADRDAWKGIGTSALAKLDRLTDVVETLSGRKLAE